MSTYMLSSLAFLLCSLSAFLLRSLPACSLTCLIWSRFYTTLIWDMQEALGNSIRAHTPRTCPTQSMSFMSGSMTDLLHAPLGDRWFSDRNSIGYQTRESSRSALDAGQFMNDRDPHRQLYPTPPPHSTPLWSPFAHHKHTQHGTNEVSGECMSDCPVFCTTNSLFPRAKTTSSIKPPVKTCWPLKIPSICAYTWKTSGSLRASRLSSMHFLFVK